MRCVLSPTSSGCIQAISKMVGFRQIQLAIDSSRYSLEIGTFQVLISITCNIPIPCILVQTGWAKLPLQGFISIVFIPKFVGRLVEIRIFDGKILVIHPILRVKSQPKKHWSDPPRSVGEMTMKIMKIMKSILTVQVASFNSSIPMGFSMVFYGISMGFPYVLWLNHGFS